MKRKILSWSVVVVFLFLLAGWLTLSTPHNPRRSDTTLKTGRVTAIVADSGTGDIAIRLDNEDGQHFYINRGLQQQTNVDSMKSDLMNMEVQIAYFNGGWELFRNLSKGKHICEIKHDGEVVYSEFK